MDVSNADHIMHELHHTHGDLVLVRVLLHHQALTLKLLVVPLYVNICLNICFEGIELLYR